MKLFKTHEPNVCCCRHQNGSTFCVVPIIAAFDQPLPATFDFWAAGRDCCTNLGENFHCGAANASTGSARGGLRSLDGLTASLENYIYIHKTYNDTFSSFFKNYTHTHIYIYIYIYEPGSRFPSPPPPNGMVPQAHAPGGVRAFTTISTIAIYYYYYSYYSDYS